MSGVEIAAHVAFQLSSAENTPGKNSIENAEKYKVVHVAPKPAWILPFFFPRDPEVEIDGKAGLKEKVCFKYLSYNMMAEHNYRSRIQLQTFYQLIWSIITSNGVLQDRFKTPQAISHLKRQLSPTVLWRTILVATSLKSAPQQSP